MSDRIYLGQDPSAFNFKNILYRKSDQLATITFNHPQVLNAIITAVLEAMKLVALYQTPPDPEAQPGEGSGRGKPRLFCQRLSTLRYALGS